MRAHGAPTFTGEAETMNLHDVRELAQTGTSVLIFMVTLWRGYQQFERARAKRRNQGKR